MVVSADRKLRQFGVVVAVCKTSRGIGLDGQLPWRLRADMQYFKQLTRSTSDPCKRNAVIMGRKTWQSIPSKFRPLDDRVNVVLSRNPAARAELELPSNVLVAESLEAALEMLGEETEAGSDVEDVYVIGGASVYSEALAMRDACAKLFVTEIEQLDRRQRHERRGERGQKRPLPSAEGRARRWRARRSTATPTSRHARRALPRRAALAAARREGPTLLVHRAAPDDGRWPRRRRRRRRSTRSSSTSTSCAR